MGYGDRRNQQCLKAGNWKAKNRKAKNWKAGNLKAGIVNVRKSENRIAMIAGNRRTPDDENYLQNATVKQIQKRMRKGWIPDYDSVFDRKPSFPIGCPIWRLFDCTQFREFALENRMYNFFRSVPASSCSMTELLFSMYVFRANPVFLDDYYHFPDYVCSNCVFDKFACQCIFNFRIESHPDEFIQRLKHVRFQSTEWQDQFWLELEKLLIWPIDEIHGTHHDLHYTILECAVKAQKTSILRAIAKLPIVHIREPLGCAQLFVDAPKYLKLFVSHLPFQGIRSCSKSHDPQILHAIRPRLVPIAKFLDNRAAKTLDSLPLFFLKKRCRQAFVNWNPEIMTFWISVSEESGTLMMVVLKEMVAENMADMLKATLAKPQWRSFVQTHSADVLSTVLTGFKLDILKLLFPVLAEFTIPKFPHTLPNTYGDAMHNCLAQDAHLVVPFMDYVFQHFQIPDLGMYLDFALRRNQFLLVQKMLAQNAMFVDLIPDNCVSFVLQDMPRRIESHLVRCGLLPRPICGIVALCLSHFSDSRLWYVSLQ